MSSSAPYRDDTLNASFSPPTDEDDTRRSSIDSTSTTSLILERIHPDGREPKRYDDPDAPRDKEGDFSDDDDDEEDLDLESGATAPHLRPMENKVRRAVYIIGGVLVGGWLLALIVYLSREAYRFQTSPHDPAATASAKAGKSITLDQVQSGTWRARKKGIQWIDGERDGLMLVPDGNQGFLEIHDVKNDTNKHVLMERGRISWEGKSVGVGKYWPSPDLKHVLCASHVQSVGFLLSFSLRFAEADEEVSIGDIRSRQYIGYYMLTRKRRNR
jgi:dipeptidyl aminopeptidase